MSNKERSELLRSKNGPKKTFEVIFRFVFAVLSLPACLVLMLLEKCIQTVEVTRIIMFVYIIQFYRVKPFFK